MLQSEKVSAFGLTQSSIHLAANPGDKATADNLIGVSTVLLPSTAGTNAIHDDRSHAYTSPRNRWR